MAIKSKIRTLRAQSTQTVDLSFNMPGIVARQNFDHGSRSGPAFFGQRVKKFNIETALYKKLSKVADSSSGKLHFDSTGIRQVFEEGNAPFLFALRNEPMAVALDRAIAGRQVSYISRFKHKKKIAKLAADMLPKISAEMKHLLAKNDARFKAVDAAFGDADIPPELKGVLKRITTLTETDATVSSTTSKSEPIATKSVPFDGQKSEGKPFEIQTKNKSDELLQKQFSPRTASIPLTTSDGTTWNVPSTRFTTQVSESNADPYSQLMTSSVQALSHPKLDNEIGYRQSNIAVLQEKLRHDTNSVSVADIEMALDLELKVVDEELKQLQLNYAHTFLVTPVEGVVTGVFKDIGESVEVGEPVLRIENDTYLLLVGRVQCRSPLWANRPLTITLKSIFDDKKSKVIDGRLLSIRGHEKDNDEWDVVIEIKNPKESGLPMLPSNYQFDANTDEIEFL